MSFRKRTEFFLGKDGSSPHMPALHGDSGKGQFLVGVRPQARTAPVQMLNMSALYAYRPWSFTSSSWVSGRPHWSSGKGQFLLSVQRQGRFQFRHVFPGASGKGQFLMGIHRQGWLQPRHACPGTSGKRQFLLCVQRQGRLQPRHAYSGASLERASS